MLPLNLVLALVVSLPPSLAALSGAGHRPAPGAHNLFASPGQASSLLERAAANAAEEASAFEEELGLEGPASGELDLEELLFAKVNLTLAFDDWEEDEGDVEARLARRGLPRNPKYIPNPKYTPRTKPPTAATTVAPSTNTPRTSTPSTTVKPSTTTRTTTTTKKASTSKTTTSKTTTTSKAAATTALVLPKPPSANCWEQYTNTVAGAVYGPGLGDFPMLPRPSTFVTRTKSGLYLEGREYRIVGPSESTM